MNPTTELYQALEKAYAHFNTVLFESELPPVIFTFQRKSGVMGYFSPERWGNANGDIRNEIAINPSFLASSRLIEICQTLTHEMVHCWQQQFGKPSRNGYHNLQWAKKMITIGLMPSSTGEPGGEILGQAMGDYIIEGGAFINAYNVLVKSIDFNFPWFDRKALPRLYEPVIATLPSKDEHSSVSFLNSRHENNFFSELSQAVSESDAVPLASYFEGHEGRATLSELAPHAFVQKVTEKKSTRTKYFCNGCGVKIYGKPNLDINCNDCNLTFSPHNR